MTIITYREGHDTTSFDLDGSPGSLQRQDGKLRAPVKRKWLEALRSGRYRQTRENLKGPKGYCCLGVLACELDGVEEMQHSDWSLLKDDLLDLNLQQMFAHRNDVSKWSFKRIADWVEENL